MKKYLIIISAFALAFVSCNKQLETVPTLDGDEIAFRLEANIDADVQTRATVEDGNTLSVLYISATSGNNDTPVFTNAQFQKTGSGNNVLWKGVEQKLWPSTDNPNYHFYACNVQMNGLTVTPTNTNTDIVYDYLASPTPKTTNTLTLNHIFARVGTVRMLAPEGYTISNMSMTIQPIVGGTFNLKTEQWTSRGSNQSATLILPKAGTNPATVSISTPGGSVTSAVNDLWLVPANNYQLTVTYTIAKGDYSKQFTKSTTVELFQGVVNNIVPRTVGGIEVPNIPEPDDISEIQFTVQVQAWGTQDIQAQF